MLNKGERLGVLRAIRFWCQLGLLPAQVDLGGWKILPHAKKWTTWICQLSFFLFTLHALYKLGSLGYWVKVGIPIHEAVYHALAAIVGPTYTLWYYVLYIKDPRLFEVYFHLTLTANEDGVNTKNERSWGLRLKQCTLQDLLAITLSYMSIGAIAAMMLALMCNPSMKYLLYAILPKECQMWTTFGVLLLEELRHMTVICAIAIPVWLLQVIAFEVAGNQLQLVLESMQRVRPPSYESINKSLRHVQLYIRIVNLQNSFLIFSAKLVCITFCIGTGYAAIAHFGDYPIFGVMYYVIFFNTACIYIVCYGKAFKIPALFEKVTRRAILITRRGKSEASEIFRRQMRSIPRVGIKVGNFHLMERESTLVFIHFVFDNIVALLVTSRTG